MVIIRKVMVIVAMMKMLMDILHIKVKHTMGYLLLEIQEGKELNLKKTQLKIDQIHSGNPPLDNKMHRLPY